MTSTQTNATCVTGGTITVTVNGGAAPITFLWNDNITTQNRTNLSAGNYSVTATDANTCTFALTNITITGSVGTPTITGTPVNENCFGESIGSITTNTNGGVTPYSYHWNDGNTNANRTALPVV